MTTSEAGVRGLKPTPEMMGVWIFTFHKLAPLPMDSKVPFPHPILGFQKK